MQSQSEKASPPVTSVRPYYIKYDGQLVTFMSTMETHAEAEQEFRAEVELMRENGKRPAGVVTSRAVWAELVEAGYVSK